jgi:BirA family biotin operon repressor/biotin-[acetyl-CoA-carboxylase] ligase
MPDLKGRIVQLLRDVPGTAGEVVSGETLRAELGVSRVTVWKHIQALGEMGYEIAATPRGYQLMDSPDIPYPWEIPGRSDRVHYFPELDSTMTAARDMARAGCPHFTVVVAGRQTQGRGRLRRPWHSEAGGLYFTVVVRPDVPPLLAGRINFAASLTLCRLLRDRFGVDARTKWPNDILVDGRKICGLLSEMEAEDDRVAFVNVGIGLNVNNAPGAAEPSAVSLRELRGEPVSVRELLSAFLDAFEKRAARLDDSVVAEWKELTMTLGRNVRVVTVREERTGRAVDVDSDGALILETEEGARERVIYGDCFPAREG